MSNPEYARTSCLIPSACREQTKHWFMIWVDHRGNGLLLEVTWEAWNEKHEMLILGMGFHSATMGRGQSARKVLGWVMQVM